MALESLSWKSPWYTIWLWLTAIAMENPPFLSSVNHLFRLGPSIPWRTVSHNQRVIRVGDTAFIVFFYLPFFHAISMVDSTRRPPQQRLSRRDSARQTDGSPARPVGWNGRPMKNEQKRSATVGKCVLSSTWLIHCVLPKIGCSTQ